MKKPLLIILSGAQGVYKTTIANKLRNNLTHTTLISMCGTKSSSKPHEDVYRNYVYHQQTLDYLFFVRESQMSYIMERSFICNKVFTNLHPNRGYTYEEEFECLKTNLESLKEHYIVVNFILTADRETFLERLERDKPTFEDHIFNVENSLAQQNQYFIECGKLEIDNVVIDTTNKTSDEVYNEIELVLLQIKE